MPGSYQEPRGTSAGMRVLAVTLLSLALAPAASAAGVIEQAAQALRSDPVYVDPRAQEDVDAARVRREIQSHRAGAVYVAVLPESAANEAGGDPGETLHTLIDDVHRDGTYALIVGNHFRAASDTISNAGDLATESIDAHGGDGATATLVDFVDRVADQQAHPDSKPRGNGWILPILLIAGLAFFLIHRSRSRRRQATAELAAVKEVAHDDLIALADDVQRLERSVEGNPTAKAAYDRAIRAYGTA